MPYHLMRVLAAMDEEIACIRSLEGIGALGRTASRSTGIGKIQAALAAQEIVSNHARLPPRPVSILNRNQTLSTDALNIIVVGSAGGIGTDLKPGDVVISTEAMFHDIDASPLGFACGEIPFTGQSIWKADVSLIALAQHACRSLGIIPTLGRMLTGDRFIADPAEAKRLAAIHHGLTVDWETAAVAFVAAQHHVPWVSIRIVSDSADAKADTEFRTNLPPIAETLAAIVERIDQQLLLTE